MWKAKAIEAKVLEAGYVRGPSGAWDAQVGLRLRNLDPDHRCHRELHVDFLNAEGQVLSSVRSFVSLAGGAAQHRRYRAPRKLACPGELGACPRLSVRLRELAGEASAIPLAAVEAEKSPPEGQPLFAQSVVDGDTLVLISGERVRLLGVDTPEREKKAGGRGPEPGYQVASDYTRERCMAGPLILQYDGERQDIYGRWLALVVLEDGTLLNLDLLKKGLARAYPLAEFSRKDEFLKAESEARAAGLGLWAPAKP